MYSRKGQAALDFLMTYGWAILLVVLVAAALFVLGVFNVGSFVGSKAVGFTEIAVPAFTVDNAGSLSLKLQNQVGSPITINTVNATYGTASAAVSPAENIGVGATSNTIIVGAVAGLTSGDSYAIT
ncbi:MAG: hypothetical protein NTY83_02695, partial [Candidatus Micrarchaeota archaeon]|nr:hypothetical protein [Candidatus Micrarchaeota archaeon]